MSKKKKVLPKHQLDVLSGMPAPDDILREWIIDGKNISVVITCMTSLNEEITESKEIFKLSVKFDGSGLWPETDSCYVGDLHTTDSVYKFEKRRFYLNDKKQEIFILARGSITVPVQTK